jgi:zinc protease
MMTMLLNTIKKCKPIIVVICLSLTVFSFAQQKEKSKFFELDNGLKVYLYERHILPLLNITVAVNLGSKDETEETNGLVHLLEHSILFGGTEFRSGEEIGKDIRRHGAYFNAHTDRDLITFDISLPSEHADFAFQNQKEILFNLKLTQEEIDKEKKVILEEIAQIKDDPLRYASSLVYQNLYQGHAYQTPIIGRKEVLENVTANQVEEFYRKFFVPSNCAFAVVGDFDIDEMENRVKNILGDLKKEELPPLEFKKALPLKKTVEIEEEMDVEQAYLVIGMPGPDYNHLDQYQVDLLVQIIGRGFNPMLGSALRGRRGLVHNVSMTYIPQKYGGAILIYIILDPKNLKAARNEAIRFLKSVRNERFSEDDFMPAERMYILDYLVCAKNQIKFDFFQGREKALAVANMLARYLLLYEGPERGGFLENIEGLSSTDLRKAAANYLGTGKYVIVSIVPQKEK